MSYKLFTLKDSNIVINNEVILTIPSFTTILRRDKGSKGDSDGRKKLQAFKEFAYIYHIADIKSHNNRTGAKPKAAKNYAIEKSGLDVDWKPDIVVMQAIADYKSEQDSLPKQTIMNLIKTYAIINTVIDKLRKALQKSAESEGELSIDKATEIFKTISLLIEQGEELPKLTTKLTSAISQLELLDEKENREILRGSTSFVPDSAYPDKQL